MHRFHSRYALNRFKAAAWLLAFKWLLLAASVVVTGYALLDFEIRLAVAGLCAFVLSGVITLVQWVVATQARCPLCMIQPLAVRKCARNRNAKRLFGSCRLRVAFSIILLNRFLCPYCGEPAVLEVRGAYLRRPP